MSKERKNLNQTISGNIAISRDPDMDLDSENINQGAKSLIDYKNLEVYEFKIILIGEPGVGKTSIMSKYISNEFKSSYQSTLGVEFKSKEIYIDNSSCARLKIWDTCGQERFRSITRQYFKNSNGVFLVFDLTNGETLKKINVWLRDIKDNINDDDCVIFLIGNKMDVKTRDISISEEAKQFANDKKINYYEVSAKTGTGVINVFEKITKKMINNIKNENNNNEENKIGNKNLNIEDFNKDRGKIEQNRNKVHCC